MPPMQRILTASLLLLIALTSVAQTSSQKASVQLSATVQASPPTITLAWTTLASTTSITIYRKLKTGTSWGSAIASPAAAALTYADVTVAAGTAYEYKVVRVAGGVTGSGYIASGIDVPVTDYRGKLILLVDNTIAASLTADRLNSALTFRRLSGDKSELTLPVPIVMMQLFNHQTHHRGQVSTLLMQCGVNVGVTDLPMLPANFASPVFGK